MPNVKMWAVFGKNHILGNNSVFMCLLDAQEEEKKRRLLIASFGDLAYLTTERVTVTWDEKRKP